MVELKKSKSGMRQQVLALFLLALLAELATSWWRWVRAPTDSLRVWYKGSFVAYEAERLVPWIIILTVVTGVYLILKKR